MYNIDLTPIIQAAILLLAAIVTHKVIPWIKAKTTTEQQTFMLATVKTLVFAAEQIYGAGNGYDKMNYVKAELEKRGFTVDEDAIEATIKEYAETLHAVKPTEMIEEE